MIQTKMTWRTTSEGFFPSWLCMYFCRIGVVLEEYSSFLPHRCVLFRLLGFYMLRTQRKSCLLPSHSFSSITFSRSVLFSYCLLLGFLTTVSLSMFCICFLKFWISRPIHSFWEWKQQWSQKLLKWSKITKILASTENTNIEVKLEWPFKTT